MIVKVISLNEFIDILLADDYANWSYDGAECIYHMLCEYAEDVDAIIKLDLAAIRGQFSEMTEAEFVEQYGVAPDKVADDSGSVRRLAGTDRFIVDVDLLEHGYL